MLEEKLTLTILSYDTHGSMLCEDEAGNQYTVTPHLNPNSGGKKKKRKRPHGVHARHAHNKPQAEKKPHAPVTTVTVRTRQDFAHEVAVPAGFGLERYLVEEHTNRIPGEMHTDFHHPKTLLWRGRKDYHEPMKSFYPQNLTLLGGTAVFAIFFLVFVLMWTLILTTGDWMIWLPSAMILSAGIHFFLKKECLKPALRYNSVVRNSVDMDAPETHTQLHKKRRLEAISLCRSAWGTYIAHKAWLGLILSTILILTLSILKLIH